MMEQLEIGPVPAEEDCQQVGTADYDVLAARNECKRFMALIEQTFPGKPETAYLKVGAHPHDFGTYYEVAVKYDPNDEIAVRYAFAIEADAPSTWDDTRVRNWREQ